MMNSVGAHSVRPIYHKNGMKRIEAVSGSYVLVLRAIQTGHLRVGRLGYLDLWPGWYLYAGSAFGPGGLRARVGRHLAGTGPLRWHIDYLRRVTMPVDVWIAVGHPCEHTWARALAASRACQAPLARFGASDCRCPAHLFYRAERPELAWFVELLAGQNPCGAPIQALTTLDQDSGL